jgi:hypothetical protein
MAMTGPDPSAGLPEGIPAGDRAAVERWRRVERLAHVMDSAVRVPGTDRRIGADGLVGLVPGLGDAATLGVAGLIVVEAIRLGARGSTIARMLLTVALDALIGAVPLVGWIGDFAYKGNSRNVALLRRHALDPTRTRAESRRAVVVTVIALLVIAVLIVVAVGALLAWGISRLG